MKSSLKKRDLLKKTDPTKGFRGFTLIELLVVIAIIGVLSTVVLAALQSARNKGNDAKRFSDLRQMETALDSYYADNGHYPINSNCSDASIISGAVHWCTMCAGGGTIISQSATTMIPGLSPAYIPSIPMDPQGTTLSSCYIYATDSGGANYKFQDYQPNVAPGTGMTPSATGQEATFFDTGTHNNSWSVYSPNGKAF